MTKKLKHRKKHAVTTGPSSTSVVGIHSEDLVKQATITDLKKTAILITMLFAVEFLIFYANLMGVGA